MTIMLVFLCLEIRSQYVAQADEFAAIKPLADS